MTKNEFLTLCVFTFGFAFFGALSGYGMSLEDADVLKTLAKGGSGGAGFGFMIWFFFVR